MLNVRARAIYSQYMIQIGADLTIILGLGFVRASCSVIEESRTFFGAIKRSQAMSKVDFYIIKTVVRSMKRRNIYENYLELLTVAAQLNLKLDFEEVEFDDDDLYCFPILLCHIYSTLIHDGKLYILCDNCALHILDLKTKDHRCSALKRQPRFSLLDLWILQLRLSNFSVICCKCFDYIKKRISLSSDFIEHLNSLSETETSEKLNPETGALITDILANMEKENLLGTPGKENAIELKLETETYICLLDESHKLKRLFRVTRDDKK